MVNPLIHFPHFDGFLEYRHQFAGLLGVVIICEVAAGITVAVLRKEVNNYAHNNMLETMDSYKPTNSNVLATGTWDDLQQEVRLPRWPDICPTVICREK